MAMTIAIIVISSLAILFTVYTQGVRDGYHAGFSAGESYGKSVGKNLYGGRFSPANGGVTSPDAPAHFLCACGHTASGEFALKKHQASAAHRKAMELPYEGKGTSRSSLQDKA